MIAAIIGEIPAIILAFYLVEHQQFGRKNTMVIFFALSGLFNFLSYIDFFFAFSLMASRFCFRVLSGMLYTYSTEVYPTHYRTVGIGWATGFGRIGTFLMPFIVIDMYQRETRSPFIYFLILSIIGIYTSFTLPYDTRG